MNALLTPAKRIILENGDIVTPHGTVEGACIVMEDGMITHIQQGSCSLAGTRLNVKRQLILPGFIDLHSDALEKYIEPRTRAVFPIPAAIMEFDKTLPACGVTTMFNCIAYVYDDKRNRTLRTNDMANTILAEVQKLIPWLRTRTRAHVRFDILNREAIPILSKHIEDGLVHLVSFMDHTPGQGQYQDIDEYKDRMICDYDLEKEIVEADIEARRRARRFVKDIDLLHITNAIKESGVALASHDDDSEEKIGWCRKMGVTISEFPVCTEAAKEAKRCGLHTVFGAPNVLRGGSQSGNMSASEAMLEGYGDILSSDYSPMSLFHAIFKMVTENKIPLHEAVKWITLNPAKAVGLEQELGSLEVGKKADVVIVNPSEPVAHITTTFTDGKVTYAGDFPFKNSEKIKSFTAE